MADSSKLQLLLTDAAITDGTFKKILRLEHLKAGLVGEH